MTKTYTFNECYDLLDVDPKTFRRWLEKAGIDPKKQKSKIDERIRYLTESQVSQLAADHGRTLQAPPPHEEETITPAQYKLMVDRLAQTEEDAKHLHSQIAEQANQLLAFGGILQEYSEQLLKHAGRIEQLEATVEDQTDKEGQLESTIQAQAEALNSLSAQIAHLEATTQAQEEELTLLKEAEKSRAHEAGVSNSGEKAGDLPSDLVSWRAFTEQHGMSVTSTRRMIDAGIIPVVHGTWKVGRGLVKMAFDAEGRHAFWEHLHTREGFASCEDCPH